MSYFRFTLIHFMLLLGMASSQSMAMTLDEYKASKFYLEPHGHAQVRMKNYIDSSGSSEEIKAAAAEFFSNVEVLDEGVQFYKHNPDLKVDQKEFKQRLEVTRKSYVAMMNALAGNVSAKEEFQRIAEAIIDRHPDSEKNKILYGLFSKEYARAPKGAKRMTIDFLNRHPMTSFINCMLGGMACVMAASGNFNADDLPKLLQADVVFSAGFLFLEANLGKDADQKLARMKAHEEHSEQGKAMLAEDLAKSLHKKVLESYLESPDEALDKVKKLGSDFYDQKQQAASDLEAKIKARLASLSVSSHANLEELQKGILETENDLTKLRKIQAEIQAKNAQLGQLTPYYDSMADVAFLSLLRKLDDPSFDGKLIDKLRTGQISLDEAEYLHTKKYGQLPKKDNLIRIAALALGDRATVLREMAAMAADAQMEMSKRNRELSLKVDGMQSDGIRAIEDLKANLAANKELVDKRLAEEALVKKAQDEERARLARIENERLAIEAEHKKIEAWRAEGRLGASSIKEDLTKLQTEIAIRASRAKVEQEASRNGTGNVKSWFAATESEMNARLRVMNQYHAPLADIQKRILLGLNQNPTLYIEYLDAANSFNSIIDQKLSFWGWGGFGRPSRTLTVPLFGMADGIQALKLDPTAMAITCATMFAKGAAAQ